jgi:hypothetical protein
VQRKCEKRKQRWAGRVRLRRGRREEGEKGTGFGVFEKVDDLAEQQLLFNLNFNTVAGIQHSGES